MHSPERLLSTLFSLLVAGSISSAASAATISTVLTPFTGSPIEVELVLSDDVGDGKIRGSLEVVSGVGDLRGLFLDVADDSLLAGLTVTGDDVTAFETGDIRNLGQGVNLSGGGSPCPCDFAISFGSPGTGGDDIDFTEFVISHDFDALTLAVFAGQYAGVRVTSVGDDYDSGREGSAKLVATVPVPEPTTAALLLLGLAGVAVSARRRRRLRAS